MLKLSIVSITCLAALSLSSYSASAMGKSPRSLRGKTGIRTHHSVPEKQLELLRSDTDNLFNLPMAAVPLVRANGAPLQQEATRILGIERFANANLRMWLSERIKWLVGESFKEEERLEIVDRNYSFPKPGELPIFEQPTVDSPSRGIVGMSNLGAALYLRSKRESSLYSLKLGAFHNLKIKSPRIGIVRIGAGLFAERYAPNPEKPEAISNSIRRISTFFHEARHSDGNGKALSFYHAVCPAGTLRGKLACDRNLNGPYSIEAMMLQILAENCKAAGRCDEGELEFIRLTYLEMYSRVIEFTPIGHDGIHEQIAKIEETLRACEAMSPEVRDTMTNLCGNLPGLERQLSQLREVLGRGIPSTEWDTEPEVSSHSGS